MIINSLKAWCKVRFEIYFDKQQTKQKQKCHWSSLLKAENREKKNSRNGSGRKEEGEAQCVDQCIRGAGGAAGSENNVL